MKQLIQQLDTGQTRLVEVPAPGVRRGHVLIRTRRTLVSPGTERMLVEFGRSSLLAKARQQPERVQQVLDKLRTDGVLPTLEAVFRKLQQPLPLGYCHVGEVLALGEGVTDLRVGQRVASNGPHAEVVCVPRSLVAPVPDAVSDDEAAFTVAGAIALQGIRLLNPTLGETVVVTGLGLIGLLTTALLRINGCRVIGLDPAADRRELARQQGVTVLDPTETNVVAAVTELTGGVGADGVLLTASSRSDALVAQAARMSRKRGRLVLVGVVGLHLNRADFYEKELQFQVSCSYGPGRYDDAYEQQGHDYPLPYVRWTENRNFQTVLHLLETGQLAVRPLIAEIVPLADYARIYDHIGESGAVASLLSYPTNVVDVAKPPATTFLTGQSHYVANPNVVVGLIGAGNFTGAVVLPALKKAGVVPAIIASAGGLRAQLLANQFGIGRVTTDFRAVLTDPAINAVLITTRHDSHAYLTAEALRAGKHVFVEKPLVIHEHELPNVVAAQRASGHTVLVGFNRRFAPLVAQMKTLLGGDASGTLPMHVVATLNAGTLPPDAWLHNRNVGGGRLLGEACHYVDLTTFLTGSRVVAVCLNALGTSPTDTTDSATLLLRYANGSTGVINYVANGSRAYAKERVEVHSQGRTLVLDNFRRLQTYGFRSMPALPRRQDKGHSVQFARFIERLRTGGEPLIPFAELVNTSQTLLAALRSGREGRWVLVDEIATEAPGIATPAVEDRWSA